MEVNVSNFDLKLSTFTYCIKTDSKSVLMQIILLNLKIFMIEFEIWFYMQYNKLFKQAFCTKMIVQFINTYKSNKRTTPWKTNPIIIQIYLCKAKAHKLFFVDIIVF